MKKTVLNAAQIVRKRCGFVPDLAMILGSGLSSLADEVENPLNFKYAELPDFPISTVRGHRAELVTGMLSGKKIIVFKGRLHYYEGYSMEEVVYPVHFLKALGCPRLLLTNAAGAVNRNFKVGDLMLITDHINLSGQNPLRGSNDDGLGPRFPDLSDCWSGRLNGIMKSAAAEIGLVLREGVYTWFSGPSYESPAEIRMTSILGGDAVGMSTVPEAIAAAHCGIETAAVSCLTNMAAGILDQKISAEEVIETADSVRYDFSRLIKTFVGRL